MPNTAILILNWNNQAYLEKFIPTMLSFTPAGLAKIVVADNGSTDNSVNWLKENHPEVGLVILEKNFGFAGGYNQAIEKCEYENIVLVNSDIQVTKNWLPPLLDKLLDKKVGAVMPKVLAFDAQDQFEYAGAAGGFIDKFAYPFCRGRIFDTVEKDSSQYDSPMKVHWTTGACMIIKRQAFIDAGSFDSDFFAHMEEIDLCWRIRRMGLELWVQPESIVYHVGGGTLPNESPHKLYLNFRNNLALLYKNLPPRRRFVITLLRLCLDGVAAIQYLSKGKINYVLSVLKAHWHFFFWIPRLNKKIKRSSIPFPETQNFTKSIVWQYFIKGTKKFSELNYK